MRRGDAGPRADQSLPRRGLSPLLASRALTKATADTIPLHLRDLLRRHLGEPTLGYVEPPEAIPGGYDTQIFSFHVAAGDPAWARPLILRVLGPHVDPRRALREEVIQNTVAALGFPAPRVLLASADPAALGGAFLVMEHVPGHPMLAERRLGIASTLAATQARLHAFDAEPLLDAMAAIGAREAITFEGLLGDFEQRAAHWALEGLRSGVAWLRAHRPPPLARLSICHGDFHPQNVLMSGVFVTGVLDWPNTVVAEPAYDVAATRVILGLVPVELSTASPALRAVLRVLRPLLLARYLRAYGQHAPVNRERLSYYEAVACIRHLVRIAEAWAGIRTMTPLDESLFGEDLARRFASITGVAPKLPS